MAAPLVRRSRGVLVGGCETIRSPAGFQPGAGRPGQGAGLHTADAGRPTVVPLVVPGTGPAGPCPPIPNTHNLFGGPARIGCPRRPSTPAAPMNPAPSGRVHQSPSAALPEGSTPPGRGPRRRLNVDRYTAGTHAD